MSLTVKSKLSSDNFKSPTGDYEFHKNVNSKDYYNDKSHLLSCSSHYNVSYVFKKCTNISIGIFWYLWVKVPSASLIMIYGISMKVGRRVEINEYYHQSQMQ